MVTLIEKDAVVSDVRCDDRFLTVQLTDGREIKAPLWWYPRLYSASPKQRQKWEPCGAGYGIHWPDVDEDISIAAILNGIKAPDAKAPVH